MNPDPMASSDWIYSVLKKINPGSAGQELMKSIKIVHEC